MDYQTFNSQQQHSFNGPYSTLPGAPTHSPQGGHVNNTDPTARFQSSPSPFPNGQGGGFPINMGGGSSGAMMQPGGGLSHNQLHQARAALQQQQQHQHQQWQQQQQQQQQQQHLQSPSPYGNPSFSQSLASPAHQQFAQNRQTISPSSANSNVPSYATPQNPQPSPGLVPSHSQQQSMAAPSIKHEPVSQSMQVQTPVKAVPQSPVSPTAQARDQERMATLLEINTLLIKEAIGLQKEGKSGQIGQAPSQDGKPDGEKPTKEYLELMRRLQSNLAFLAQNAEKTHKPNQALQPGPAIMAAPSAPAELVKLYIKLQGLFPGWKGQTMPMKASPGPQRIPSTTQPNSAGLHSSMQPPNSAGLMNPNNAIKQEQQQQHTSTPPQNAQS